VPTVADKPNAEYLYYVGCAGAFDDRNKKTTQAFARLLEKAGVDFACLGKEEPATARPRAARQRVTSTDHGQACIESFDTAGVEEGHRQLPALLSTPSRTSSRSSAAATRSSTPPSWWRS